MNKEKSILLRKNVILNSVFIKKINQNLKSTKIKGYYFKRMVREVLKNKLM